MFFSKSGNAGNIFPGNTGYLQIGLTTYDVKIVASKKEQIENNEPSIRLVQYDKRKGEIKKDICGLSKEIASTGNTFFQGVFNIGFGYMEIKLWYVAKESRKSENSPIMFILGSLQHDKNEQNKKKDEKESSYGEVDLDGLVAEEPKNLQTEQRKFSKEPIQTVFQSLDDLDDIDTSETIITDIPDI
ncbi:MAG: hypothetical protein RBT59_04595 [Arcobacteraceae bacterium]|jgi:hypothetical protein|nr:hypothetical protein [Arcobacteraceae bacterium]